MSAQVAAPVGVFPGSIDKVVTGGQSVVALFGGALGGYIINPQLAADQGLPAVEILFVDPTGPASLFATVTTVAIQPGEAYEIPAGQTTPTWVNSRASGHRFTSVLIQLPITPTIPIIGPFPPAGPTTLQNVIKSYLYQEYSDDDDLQAFVDSFNSVAQNYVDTFNALNLPVYTGSIIFGALLDWVAEGLYGMSRPALSSGKKLSRGPLNTYALNTWQIGRFALIEPGDIVATNDDIFKRILTWHLYKGDGKTFNIRWLKRRIMRFLIGENGSAPNIDETYQISVTFGPNGEVSIRLLDSIRTITSGALLGSFLLNTMRLNQLNTIFTSFAPLPNVAIFKEAVDSGALELPFQFSYTITI